jgi:hypothetical protein
MTGSSRTACAVFAVAVALALPAPGRSQAIEHFLDLDANPGTGCTVTTVDGPFPGVEQVLETQVSFQGTPPGGAFVGSVTRRECTDPGANVFGPPIPVDPGGWPVEVGLGTDGSHVVETYWSLASLASRPSSILLGVEVSDEDALLDLAFFLAAPAVPDVPTLSEWGALVLLSLLAILAVRRLRSGPRAAWLLVAAGLGVATAAWAACVLDGQVGDWESGNLLDLDPVGDVPQGADDLRAVLAQECPDRICFRVDALLVPPPVP